MKTLVFLLLLNILFVTTTSTEAYSGYDGEPGCRTNEEIGNIYRNFWDPTRYWQCVGLNMKALSVRCEDGYAFMTSVKGCVAWIDWVWEEEVPPPSRPSVSAIIPDIPVDVAA